MGSNRSKLENSNPFGVGKAPPTQESLMDAMLTPEEEQQLQELQERNEDLQAQVDSAIVPVGDDRMVFRRFHMTSTDLIFPPDATIPEADELGIMLSGLDTAMQWWIGSWANFYTRDIADKNKRSAMYGTLAAAFGFEHQTIKDYAWVYRTIPASWRKDGHVTFTHHLEVARLGEYHIHHAQALLEEAFREGYSTRDLRRMVVEIKNPKQDIVIHDYLHRGSKPSISTIETSISRAITTGKDKDVVKAQEAIAKAKRWLQLLENELPLLK